MRTDGPGEVQRLLQRLGSDEAALEREIQSARSAADACVAVAREEARRIRDEGRARAEREAAALGVAAERERERAVAAERAAAELEIARIRRAAEANAAALRAELVALVLGRPSP